MSANRVISVQTEELFQACEAGNEQVVADLIQDSRADVNWQCKQSYGATPLVVAISNGHLEVVEMLLKANAELGVLKTPDRNSPLHEAASKGDPKILQLVLNKVFDISSDDASDLINFQNQFGNTPLHNAARTGNPKCVAQLLQAGAEYSIRNTNGSIPLHHACYCEKLNLEVVQLLVEAGSDVDALDEQHQSPLIVAAKKNQLEVMKYLRDKGADATLENSNCSIISILHQFGENAHHFAKLCDNNSNTFQSK